MAASTLSDNMTVVAMPGQISSNLDGEEVILDVETGVYYGLNPVGAHIWALVQEPCAISTICATLQEEYEVDPAQCRQDVLLLLSQLADARLIEVVDVPLADIPTTPLA